MDYASKIKEQFEFSRKSTDAAMASEGDDGVDVIVGEELFVSLCEAWIDSHGLEILEKVLARKIVKPRLPRQKAGILSNPEIILTKASEEIEMESKENSDDLT